MDEPFLSSEAALDLTQAILARTSGSPCQRLQDLACAFLDSELDTDQTRLIHSHLDHCPACSALVAALVESQEVLPKLVEVNPGPWFSQRILRATVHQPLPPGFDLSRAWKKLMHRPRIALEAAYLGAAASLMGIYLPIPAPSFAVKVPALVQPLSASAHRVAGRLVQAERRTTITLQQRIAPLEIIREGTQTAQGLWQRFFAGLRTWLPPFRKAQPSSAKVETTKIEEKKPQPANP